MQHNRKLTSCAQNLRKNMTKEERRLWYEYLHSYPYQFRRQVHLEIIFWIFIAPLRNWQLNWMVPSIMRQMARPMMPEELCI